MALDDLLVPHDVAVVAAQARARGLDRHPGLTLDRLPRHQHVDHHLVKQAQADETEVGQSAFLRHVTTLRTWTGDQYAKLIRHLEGGCPVFINTCRSRIALHLSRAGGLENANCCLHPIHGFAYLPGSGLKGLAHAYAAHLWESGQVPKEQRGAFAEEVEDIFGWAPNSMRNGSEDPWQPRSARTRDEGDACRGQVVFHDAFADAPPALEVDVCTPHYGPYYAKGEAPGDWHSPVPVTFLTIAAGTKFRFRVTAAHSGVDPELVDAAKRLLLGGLYWLGAGAKTAAGYGAFDDQFTESEEQKAQRIKAEAEKAQAAANNRLLTLYASLDHAKQALWVPKQAGSGKGFRLTRATDGTWSWIPDWEFGKNPQPKTEALVYLADVNPTVPNRVGNPRLQEGILPPPNRPR